MKAWKEAISESTTFKKIADMTVPNRRCDDCSRHMVLKDGKELCLYCTFIKAEDERIGAETMRHYQQMQLRKQTEHFQTYSLINKKLEKATFDTYEPQNAEQQAAKEECVHYAEAFDPENPTNMFIYGPYGTGKSHLAKSITDVVMAKNSAHDIAYSRHITTLFFSMEKLMSKIKSTFKDDKMTEFQFMEMLAKVDLLVLDDLGSERKSTNEDDLSWATTKFFEIADSRAGRATIITMNFTPGQMLKVYGERDGSRLMEDAELIQIPGLNYRLRKFRK